MSTIEPMDKWSIREQVCLASAVVRFGVQNWMTVSDALKSFTEPNRPPDWFSPKNCAAQYGFLLENFETQKCGKSMSGSETVIETLGESILKKLKEERIIELRKKMEEKRREFLKHQQDIELIRSGAATDSMIEQMYAEIDEEEKRKEQDAIAHAQWLKEREERKLEIERASRQVAKVSSPVIRQKRKASESLDASITETDESASPLLTKLLKTPSRIPIVASSILYSAITQRDTTTSPTIASLLNTSASVPVSPSLQQLVNTAISQEPASTPVVNFPPLVSLSKPDTSIAVTTTTTLMTTVKEEFKQTTVEDSLLKSSRISDKIMQIIEPEVLNESVEEDIIITTDNDDTKIKVEGKPNEVVEDVIKDQGDVYNLNNDSKISSDKKILEESNLNITNEVKMDNNDDQSKENIETIINTLSEAIISVKLNTTDKEIEPDSVEIVEIVVEDEDSDKEMNKEVSEIKQDIIRNKKKKDADLDKESTADEKPAQKETSVYDEYDFDDIEESDGKLDDKSQTDLNIDAPEFSQESTCTPEFSESIYDDMSIEVNKQEKSGKPKRDYSRTLEIKDEEKAVNTSMEENEVLEETGSEKDSQDSDKKSDSSKHKFKDNTERSNSPWTKEEEALSKTKRRLSATPATSSDSISNSQASGNAIFDDDRDYRTWKKSVMSVYNRLAAHKFAYLFLKPITEEQVPGYHSIIYRPMDLQTIRKRIENGVIRTTVEFQRDVMLMFSNALMYNKRDGSVYEMVQQMQLEALYEIDILQAAQALLETPARRKKKNSKSGLKRKR